MLNIQKDSFLHTEQKNQSCCAGFVNFMNRPVYWLLGTKTIRVTILNGNKQYELGKKISFDLITLSACLVYACAIPLLFLCFTLARAYFCTTPALLNDIKKWERGQVSPLESPPVQPLESQPGQSLESQPLQIEPAPTATVKSEIIVNSELTLEEATPELPSIACEEIKIDVSIDPKTVSAGITQQWSEAESNRLAKSGFSSYHQEKDHLGRDSFYINKITSSTPGFGTAITRQVVNESLNQGLEGRVHLEAAWSSHLFWLYMGFVPVDRELDLIPTEWGVFGTDAVNNFQCIKNKIQNKIPLSEEEDDDLIILKKILSEIKKIDKKQISEAMIIEAEAEFNCLKDRKVSYIEYQFVPKLLDILRKNPKNPRPSTDGLSSVHMVLSDEGLKRWSESIKMNMPFQAFKQLEPLRQLMNPKQLNELDQIMAIRTK